MCNFFVDTRNIVLKEGPAPLHRQFNLSLNARAVISISASATIIRGTPWYRRPPNIIWEDLRHGVSARLRPIRAALSALIRRIGELPLLLSLGRSRVASDDATDTEPVRGGTYKVEWRFEGAPDDRAATDLIRAYLSKLELVVSEAERKFFNAEGVSIEMR